MREGGGALQPARPGTGTTRSCPRPWGTHSRSQVSLWAESAFRMDSRLMSMNPIWNGLNSIPRPLDHCDWRSIALLAKQKRQPRILVVAQEVDPAPDPAARLFYGAQEPILHGSAGHVDATKAVEPFLVLCIERQEHLAEPLGIELVRVRPCVQRHASLGRPREVGGQDVVHGARIPSLRRTP